MRTNGSENPLYWTADTDGSPEHQAEDRKLLRTIQLRALTHDYLRIIANRSDDPMQGHVQGFAQRAITYAEAALVELDKIEAGERMKDEGGHDIEQHMIQGTLFAVFRGAGNTR